MRATALIIFVFITFRLTAQEDRLHNPIVNNVEISFELGLGGGTYGVQLKANHWWLNRGNYILQSGLSLSLFHGSENDFIHPNTTARGHNFDTHLRFYSGIQQYFSKEKRKGSYSFELYGGAYHIYTNGNVSNPDLNINSDFKSGKILGDYGVRVSYGYQFSEKIGTRISINNSLRQVNSDYHPLIRFLSMEPDAKTSIGIGVNYGLQ